MIAGIILGAGASKRMGTEKQTLDFVGRPMIQHVLDAFLASSLDEVILVLSPDIRWRPRRRKRLRTVLNSRSAEGISSSVKAGIEAVETSCKAVMIGLADKPFLRASTIDTLLETYRQTNAEIVVPVRRGRRGNPVIFRRALFPELRKLKGDVGAKVLVESDKYSVAEVPVKDAGIHIDVDTPEDYRRAKMMLSSGARLGEGEARKQVRVH